MRDLPRRAQVFLVTVCAAGAISAALACLLPRPPTQAAEWEILLLLTLSFLAGSKRVALVRGAAGRDEGSMSVGFAITFAAIVRLGPPFALLIAAAGCLSSSLFPNRLRLVQLVFNVSLTLLDTWLASVAFIAANGGGLSLQPVRTFCAMLLGVAIYYALNTGAVAAIISHCSDRKPWRVWRDSFAWTGPGYFAAASISTLALILFGRNAGVILLFLSPIAVLVYQSYVTYTAHIEEQRRHQEDLNQNQRQLADLYLATVESLALAIDAKDQYTHQHILRVQRYAVATAKQLGLSGSDLEGLRTGALLHDVGKLGVPEYVLLKPGKLTEEEFAKIKKHPEIGAAILDPVQFPWPVLPVVKYHHEKWDGTGYPEGLKGEQIPYAARILAVADVYDALTSTRSYRDAWSHERAIKTIQEGRGTHFDPAVADAFLEVIDGIVHEMALEGVGPLAPRKQGEPKTRTDEAAFAIQRAASELWALYEVAQTLSSSLGLQETLEILARKLSAILPGTGCVFLLKSTDEPEALLARAAVGIDQEFLLGARTTSTPGCSRRVVAAQESYLGPFSADDLLLSSSPVAPWTPLNSALIVPIVHQGQVLGTINLYHPEPDAFSAHDRQLLEAISERAAMAIYNGLLFDRTLSQAWTDPLTGLFNLRYLTERVDEWCRRPRLRDESGCKSEAAESAPVRRMDSFALLCMDLDSFKPVNDNFGHQRGDRVLRELSKIFLDTMREGDVVARYGGDEFVVVVRDAGPEEAKRMAERLKQAVCRYEPDLRHDRLGHLRLGVSVGIACFPQDGQDCAALISVADARMYADKNDRKLGVLAGWQREVGRRKAA